MKTSIRPIALVTGASSGIGKDLAREFARDGYDLVLAARRVPEMESLARELEAHGAKTSVIASDLSRDAAPQALVRELEKRDLPIDVLVNNAGLGSNGRFDQSDVKRIEEMLRVNVVSLTELTRLLLPPMIERHHGGVLQVASTAAFQPGPSMAVYCATKAYVLSLGEAIAYELRGTGVTVTTLCPGATSTDFSKVADMGKAPLFESWLSSVMTSAEVARLGYRGFKAGQRVVITGALNKLTALSGRYSPRFLSLPIANSLMSSQ
jgi:short-subunit dehydrogenase